MAHVTVQWTDNLEDDLDVKAFLRLIAEEFGERSDGVFPIGGIRVRAIRITDYVIADGKGPDDAFINLDVLMAPGRPEEFKKAFFDQLFARIEEFLGGLFERRPLGVTLYVSEAAGWKRNSIHKRLAKG
jgi:5-carboxymethyl-2-hydroxymuconate isomerase